MALGQLTVPRTNGRIFVTLDYGGRHFDAVGMTAEDSALVMQEQNGEQELVLYLARLTSVTEHSVWFRPTSAALSKL